MKIATEVPWQDRRFTIPVERIKRCERFGFDAVFTDPRYNESDVEPTIWVRAVADAAVLAVWCSVPFNLQRAEQALANARELDDRPLLVRALTARHVEMMHVVRVQLPARVITLTSHDAVREHNTTQR